MGFLNKLFGKTSASTSTGGGRMSMMALTVQQNHKLSSRRCGLDGQTFPCPSITHTVITGDINRFALDVGGYCPSCRDFRCHDHVEFKEMESMTFGIHCLSCGTRVTGVAS